MSAPGGSGSASSPVGQLIVQLGEHVVQTLPLNQPVITIGRTPDNDLSLPHPMVSRAHAELRLRDEGLVLTDIGSTHGTFIDGVRLLEGQPRQIANGQTFTVGPFTLTYDAFEAAPKVEAPAPSTDIENVEPERRIPAIVPGAVPPVTPPRPPRPTFPVPPLPLRPSQYVSDLPVIFQDSDFLSRFLLMFETIWEPLEHRQRHIHMYFNPHTAPAGFLPWLAGWLDLPHNQHWSEARLRDLLADAMDLYRWRGTRYGLARMIEIHFGVFPEIVEDDAEPYVFRVRVGAGSGADLDRAAVEDVIRMHKPAHTGYILEIAS